jgi:BirA family transcriptional regulator, biotin operon repressor / biotin---[acetyl-CoA-carboxylase] ligase
MRLDHAAVAAGVRLVVHDALGSTNAEALALVRSGDAGPLWITARRQTAGRGRRGRNWVSEAGNLYATLLLSDPSPAQRAPELSFVAALAVHDALAQLAPGFGGGLKLKWPNDVLVEGSKVGGILVEGESTRDRSFAVAIGIGVNCRHHPANLPQPAANLHALGVETTPEAVFLVLSRTMLERLQQWDEGRGFVLTRRDWLDRAIGIGAPIRVRTAESDVEGIFAALDSAGHLILDASDGTSRVISGGDVFPLQAKPIGVDS